MTLKKGQFILGQEEINDTKMFFRRAKVTYLKNALIILALLIAPFIIPWLISLPLKSLNTESQMPSFVSLFLNSETSKFVIIISSTYLLCILGYFIYTWIDYYFDVTIVTKDQLINVRQDGILSRTVAEQSLLRIQDVSGKISGPIQSYFNYGTVFVETAGEQPNFKMINIRNPHMVATTIIKLSEELLEEHNIKSEIATGVGIDKLPSKNNKNTDIPLEAKKIAKNDSIEPEIKEEDSVITINQPKTIQKETYQTPKVNKIPSEKTNIQQTKKEPIENSWTSNFIEKESKEKNKPYNMSQSVEEHEENEEGDLEEGKDLKL